MASAFEIMRKALKTLQSVDLSDIEPSKAEALESVRADLEAAALKIDNLCAPKPPSQPKQVRFESPQPEPASPPKGPEPLPLMPAPKAAAPEPTPEPLPLMPLTEKERLLKAIASASREAVFAELELMGWPDYMLTEYTSLFRFSYSDEYLRTGLSWFVESTGSLPSEVPAEKQHLVDYRNYFRLLDRLTKEQFAKDFRCAYRDSYTEEDLMRMGLDYLRLFAKDWIVVHMRLPFAYPDLLKE